MWVAILVCGFSMAMFTACGSSSKDDEPGGNGTDDLAYLQRRIAEEGNLVYGGQLANEGKDIINRPVETQEEALEFCRKNMRRKLVIGECSPHQAKKIQQI